MDKHVHEIFMYVCSIYLLNTVGMVPEICTESENAIDTDPCWNLDVTFEKSTSISYGPWADRQRQVIVLPKYKWLSITD